MRIIGLISGTSADGIDTALCEIEGAPPSLRARIVAGQTYPYPPELRTRILASYEPSRSRVDELCRLNVEVGEVFAQAVTRIIQEAGLAPGDIDLIASHGQTVWHDVMPDGSVHSGIQLGEGAVIAERTGITTINNLRSRDIAAGGQGAPLAGYVDWLLLRHPTKGRAVQNLGGIGNVTFLPPLSDESSEPMAFDTGPSNALIDDVLRLATDGRQSFDVDGALAHEGTVDTVWLEELLAHPYYQRHPPKTTGRELFGSAMATELLAEGKARGLTLADIVATITSLTARSVSDAYRRFAPFPIDEVILGGGGRHNPTLVAMLREQLAPAQVLTQEDIGQNSDYKEALLCAVIGYETWHARAGTHPAVTGARHPVVLGQITPGANYVDLIRKTWCGG
ncbi:MAG TPA: anhydro-N-acetylmuramic acid kinase [Thermomicrobiales bacterium]|nr:anhydro-N-acetylmuramic acid kinase [Thermomicrobiales bacterium]